MTRAIIYLVAVVSVVVIGVSLTGRTFNARLAGFQVRVQPVAAQDEPTDIDAEPAPPIGAGSVVAGTDEEQWAIDFLTARGITNPAPESVLFVMAWVQAEGTAASFNPLATSEPMPGSTKFNSDGVQEYRSRQDGITAAARTLDYDYTGYAEIAAGLERGDPDLALEGVDQAKWGTNAATLASIYNGLIIQYSQAPAAEQAQQQPQAPPPPLHGVRCKAPPTWPVNITDGFWSNTSAAWSGQWGGFHLGDDFSAAQGSTVYAPFDYRIVKIGFYDNAATYGWYVDGVVIPTGEKLYMGHLQNVKVHEGDEVVCATPIAETGPLNHTHVRLAAPNTPVPCETLKPGWGTGCVDFVSFYNSR